MRIIILSFILSILVGCNNSDKIDSNLESILGNSSIRFEKEYSKDESLSLSGEGYSIQVLILSKETIDKFINFERKTEYPAIKNGFKTSTWEKTPINSNLINVQELVVNYFVKDNKQKTYQKEIAKILNKENAYYSFYYKSVQENIIMIDFFLIDIKTRKMYLINNHI